MNVTNRRGFLLGLGALLAAPAVIRTPRILMPVRVWAGPAAQMAVGTITADRIAGGVNHRHA